MPPNAKRRHNNPLINSYLKDKFITQLQYDKLSEGHLKQIGGYNKKKNHKPKASQKGKTNKDFPKKNNKANYKKGTAAGLQNKEDKKKKQ